MRERGKKKNQSILDLQSAEKRGKKKNNERLKNHKITNTNIRIGKKKSSFIIHNLLIESTFEEENKTLKERGKKEKKAEIIFLRFEINKQKL